MSTTTEQMLMPTYTKGDRVRLHGLTKRSDLNDQAGTIAGWLPEVGRHVVALDAGERLRVRAANLAPVGAKTAQGTPTPSAPPPPPAAIDSTLYVQDGRFFLPGAPAPPAGRPQKTKVGERVSVHRIPLPAGHWTLRAVEIDGIRVAATLIATEAGDGAAGPAAWNELKGLSITRSVLTDEANADVAEAEARVEDSVLVMHITETAPSPTAPPPMTPAIAPELEARAATSAADATNACPCGADDDKENCVALGELAEAAADCTAWLDDPSDVDGESFVAGKRKLGGSNDRRPPHFVHRSLSLGARPAGRGRSRKLAQARRRALSARSEGRRTARDKARGDPLWKVARARATAVGA